MKVHLIPCFKDNYSYLIVCNKTKEAGIVDPAEASKVISELKNFKDIKLTKILTTHKHWDHAGNFYFFILGGNVEMVKNFPDLQVYGGSNEKNDIPAITHPVTDGDTFKIGELDVEVLYTPCHTKGHVQYLVKGYPNALFSGDTVFLSGCGRFFEGTAEQMVEAMNKVSKLDTETRLFCGHEYAIQNLEFSLTIDGKNEDLQKKYKEVKELREQGLPSVPSTIGEELSYNPFMRTNLESLQKIVGKDNSVDTMKEVRERKNKF